MGSDRFRKLDRERWDVIVVGSGIGGLTAAALLARRGRSVLVVDQHYVAGGNATIFKRPGYEFDIGVHYLGQCGPGGILPRTLAAAGARDVEFLPMDPDGFDTLVLPDFELRVPAGIERYRARLIEAFPREQAGIDRYVRLLEQVARLMRAGTNPRRLLAAAPRALGALRWANSTLGAFLDTCTRDPRLRAVIAAESGDYAQPPSRAALIMHAGLMAHYLDQGAFYPAGGGQVMADRLAESIERSGGKLLLSTRVEKILVEAGRAAGVVLSNKHLGQRRLRAGVVISNADIKRTLLELVEPGALAPRTLRRARGWEMSPALATLYLGVRKEVLGSRTQRTNYWVFAGYDQEREYAAVRNGSFSERPFLFVSSASLKDPKNRRLAPPGIVNLELMSLAPSAPEAWGVSAEQAESGSYSDSASYLAAKRRYRDRLLAEAERVFPGLSCAIELEELSTPLTHARYTLSSGGTSYGLALIPEQFLLARPGTRSELPGLLLCGASTRTAHGIAGAMQSGVMAAAAICGSELLRAIELAEPQITRRPPANTARTGFQPNA
jgi:all-trans-retinol 13,14-reductase